jgi:hypothetical protein
MMNEKRLTVVEIKIMIKAHDYVAINFPTRAVQKECVHKLFALSLTG